MNPGPQRLLPGVLGGLWEKRPGGREGAGSLGLTISMPFFFMRRQDLRYVRMRLRARSWNSGNCRLQDSMMAWIFSLGCLEMGTMRSRFSSTKRRTNICRRHRLWEGLARLSPRPSRPSRAGAHVEGLEALRVHALGVIHLVIVLMVVVVIVVVICCGGPAHRQVLRAATDLGFDGVVAPRAVGGGLREGGGGAEGQATVSVGAGAASTPSCQREPRCKALSKSLSFCSFPL